MKSMSILLRTIRMKFPKVVNMDSQQLLSRITSPSGNDQKQNLVLVDSRPEDEFRVSHIAGSMRLSHDAEMADIVHNIKAKHGLFPHEIICYCSVGYRSSTIADRLQNFIELDENKNEYIDTKVLSLEGGLFKWATEDKPMINIHQKPTKYVHPYSTMLGQLLPKDRRSYTPED